MPQLESSTTEKPTTTFFGKIKNAFEWIKNGIVKHPVLIAAIVAALVAATVFTGGVFLAAPAALLILSQIGVAAALIGTFVCGIMALRASNPYEYANSGERDELVALGVSDRAGERASWVLAGLGSLLSVVATSACPPVGVAVFGIFAAGLGGATAGGVTHLVTSYNKADSSIESEHAVLQQDEVIGHPSLIELSKFPSVAVEKQKEPVITGSLAVEVSAPQVLSHAEVGHSSAFTA